MAATARPRRSVLYMPGSNARALEKGRSLAADGLIMDMEDAVAPDAKQQARDGIAAALGQGGYGRREIAVRCNGLDTAWGEDDLKAAATMACQAVLIPKVESRAMIAEAENILTVAGAPDELAIWAMMETPLGMLHAEEIAFASPRMAALVLGTNDLAKDIGAQHTPDRIPFMASLELCILAGKAAGLAVLDGVHPDLNDDEGLRAACLQGKQLGMDGKTLIHPKTVSAANEAFSPAAAEVEWARRIIAAHADAVAKGQGVVLVDGKLVENLHVEQAERLVRMSEMIAEMEAEAEG